MADSSITIVGGLGRDPEIRYTAAGRAVATLGVAVSRRWMDRKSNEWQEQTSWFDVVVWGDMAENVSDTLSKGTRVIVTGRLEQRSWENEQGEKRSKVEIVADEIGVSLRWATAEVKRSERRSGGGESQGGGGGDFGGGRPAGGPSGGSSNSAPSAPPAGGGEYGFDEEPF
jgi:single stranded DNA-binding protein (ssb)